MKKMIMVIAALMLTVVVFGQSDTQSLRMDVAKVMDDAVSEYKSIYTTKTGFSDKEEAMIIVITEKVDTKLSAKKVWHSVHDVWDEIDQKAMTKFLKIKYLKIILIDVNRDIYQYKEKIIS